MGIDPTEAFHRPRSEIALALGGLHTEFRVGRDDDDESDVPLGGGETTPPWVKGLPESEE